MGGALIDSGMLASPFTVVFGLAPLLAIDACGILLSYMADEEESWKRIFWAESPFTDVSGSEAAVEKARSLPAA